MATQGRYESTRARGYRVRRQMPRPEAPDAATTTSAAPPVAVPAATCGDGIAIIAFHGMGNQIEFQTLDQVAEGLLRAEEELNGQRPAPAVQSIRADDLVLRRLRLTLSRGGERRDVDLYEVFWAPFTEGEVGVADVVSFLVRAGLNAIWRFGRTFRRWIFGKWEDFEISEATRVSLLLALGVVISLVFLNTAAGGAYALRFADTVPDWLSAGLLRDLTSVLAGLAAIYALFGGLMLIGIDVRNRRRRKKPKDPPGSFAIPSALTAIIRAAFFLAALSTLAAAMGVAAIFIKHRLGPEEPAWLAAPAWMGSTPAILIVWAILLASSFVVRSFMIKYVGDVVAYVYAFTLDRFFDIRKRIKDRANETGRAVYGLLEGDGDDARLHYRQIVMCGHSLGSVVAYDTLNRLLDDDDAARASGTTIDVLGRTTMLLTFGSPLDKTAYLFRTQQNATGEAREALAAAAQPLINDTRFRPATFKWLNIFAPGGIDLIGASVDFYDAKLSLATPVENVTDPDASIPVLAHSEHWDNKLIWRTLHERLMTC